MKVSTLEEFEQRALWLHQCPAGAEIEIVEEANDDGAGRVVFRSRHSCLRIKASKDSIDWLRMKHEKGHHCADGIIFEWTPSGIRLHIIELKAKVTYGKWKKILEQFTGALRQALAAAGVLGVEPAEVVFYTAYVTDTMGDGITPGVVKTGLGEPAHDWRNDHVNILFLRGARHVKILCSKAGEAPYEGAYDLAY